MLHVKRFIHKRKVVLFFCLTVAEKMNQFSFACIFFKYLTETGEFFTYIKESINYNSVYFNFWKLH